MSNEIIVIDNETAIAKFKDNTLETFLNTVEKNALNFVGSTETDQGRKQIISKAASIGKIKTTIEKAKKTLTEEARAFVTSVNAQGKKSFDFLTDLQARVRKPVTEYEEAEKLRIEEERKAAEYEIAWEDALKEDELFNLRREKALREEADRKKEEERLAKIEAERIERERIEREKIIAQEAAESAKREADEKIKAAERAKIEAEERAKAEKERAKREKVEAAEKAEREKQETIEKAKRDEAERIANENRVAAQNAKIQKEKDERAARNLNHRKKINREIYADFLENKIPEDVAKEIVKLIVENKIRHLSIDY